MIILRHTKLADNLNIRLSEWGMALMLLLWGTILLSPDDTLSKPAFEMLLRLAPEWAWGAGLFGLGSTRLAVLLINGMWQRSPHARAIMAGLAIFFWFQITFSIWYSGIFATAFAVYPVLMLMEAYVVIRASDEARLSDDEASDGTSPT